MFFRRPSMTMIKVFDLFCVSHYWQSFAWGTWNYIFCILIPLLDFPSFTGSGRSRQNWFWNKFCQSLFLHSQFFSCSQREHPGFFHCLHEILKMDNSVIFLSYDVRGWGSVSDLISFWMLPIIPHSSPKHLSAFLALWSSFI